MRRILSILIVLSFTLCVSANNSTFKEDFSEAAYLYFDGEYGIALGKFLPLYEADSTNANLAYIIGECFYHEQLFYKAIEYLHRSESNIHKRYNEGSYKERRSSVRAYYFLGICYQTIGDYSTALDYFDRFKNSISVDKVYYYDLIETRKNACVRAQRFKEKPVIVEIENIGRGVNSSAYEINPLVSRDDSYMVFTRREYVKNDTIDGEVTDHSMYFIFSATKTENNVWIEDESLNLQLNSDGLYIPVSISADGTFLILYRDNYQYGTFEDYDLGALYYSERKNERWGSLKKFPMPINSNAWESSAAISSDGNTLYFSSDRKGGVGGFDLFKTELLDSTWSEPINLGKAINTDYHEEHPVLLNDSILVFSSEKHDNMGGYDIFVSKRHDTVWTQAINLGYPINSSGDEEVLSPTLNGRKAYFSALRPDGYLTFGRSDIYSISAVETRLQEGVTVRAEEDTIVEPVDTLIVINDSLILDSLIVGHATEIDETTVEQDIVTGSVSSDSLLVYKPEKEAKPHKSVLTGSVESSVVGAMPQKANVKIVNLHTFDTIAHVSTSPTNQDYELELVPGDYKLIIESEGYEVAEQKLFIPAINTAGIEVTSSISPENESGGDYFLIKPVFFEYGSAELSRDAMFELERLTLLMKANPSLYLEVIGHTDSISSYSFNQQLSLRRADRVITYLVNQGIDEQRFVQKGVSFDENIAINTLEEGRQFNRRVEMRVIKSNDERVKTQDIIVPDYLKKKASLSYFVQITSNKKLTSVHDKVIFDSLGIEDLTSILKDSVYLHHTSAFNKKADAMLLLNSIIEAGYSNASIVDNFALETLKLEKAVATEGGEYTIQLLALLKPCDMDNTFEGIDNVTEYECKDGYYRYTYGTYESREGAKMATEELKTVWRKGTFIVPKSKFVETTKREKKRGKYTIQVLALRTPKVLSEHDIKYKVKEHAGDDGYYRYVTGKFQTWEEAEVALEKLKANGYPDAYITLKSKFISFD